MTKEQLARQLDGREYGNEITQEEIAIAKESGLVVMFGASDDLMELRGAIDDEVGAYDRCPIYLSHDGIFDSNGNDCNCYCRYYREAKKACKEITINWPTWSYETDIPHTTFGVYEDWELYGYGIVFEMEALECH